MMNKKRRKLSHNSENYWQPLRECLIALSRHLVIGNIVGANGKASRLAPPLPDLRQLCI
ncbi:MAG: hypothetical protein MHMPM18_002465 [Marteilia pararefringens]